MIKFFSPVIPVSASRPRVSRFGAYYSKSYNNYRRDQHKFLKGLRDKFPIDENSLFEVEMEFVCYRPKKPSNPNNPRYDIDNMVKAIMDAITYSGIIWKDDIQVLKIKASKRYQKEGEEHGTHVKVKRVRINSGT